MLILLLLREIEMLNGTALKKGSREVRVGTKPR